MAKISAEVAKRRYDVQRQRGELQSKGEEIEHAEKRSERED